MICRFTKHQKYEINTSVSAAKSLLLTQNSLTKVTIYATDREGEPPENTSVPLTAPSSVLFQLMAASVKEIEKNHITEIKKRLIS